MSRFECFGLSDSGLEDDVNDDAYAVDAELGVFLVADGMGGRPGGAQASKLAIKSFVQQMKSLDTTARLADLRLKEAVFRANQEILSLASSNPILNGLGTTLSAAVLQGARGKIVHVGDSRVYNVRAGKLTQLTKDHTLVAELVERQHLPARDAAHYPLRNLLSRFLGSEAHSEPDIHDVVLATEDWLILVTDGVTKVLGTQGIEEIVAHKTAVSAEQLCRELMSSTLSNRPDDNVTVVVARLQL